MGKIGIIYGSDTGMTEGVVNVIVDLLSPIATEIIEVKDIQASDFERFDKIILGLSTWYDGDLQSDWEDYYEEDFQKVDFSGKTVAIFGLGDQDGYGDYFVDGIGILAKVVVNNGGKLIGKWPDNDYDYIESKAKIEGEDFFYGLAIDEDNEPEKTNPRLEKWVKQIENEFNN